MQTTTAAAAPGAGMRAPDARFGLSCASITPFEPSGRVDVPRLVAHLRRVLDAGCSSFTLFGTTGEGASIGLDERERVLDAVLAELGAARALVGVMASAPADAARQAAPLLAAGGRGVLLAPPYYFKGVGDDGLFAWFARTLEALPAPRGVLLYHLPSVTQVALSTELIDRVKRAFPGAIAGVKDSGGDWLYTERLLADHPDLHILVGDERLLAQAMRHGASGAINGFSNFCTPQLLPMIERGEERPRVTALVERLLGYPVTPAIKALVAHVARDPAYARTAPPLVPLPAVATAVLATDLAAL